LFRVLFCNYGITWPETIINVNYIHIELTNAITTNVLSDSSIRYTLRDTINILHVCHIIYSSINLSHITCDFADYISLGVLDIKHIAEKDTETFSLTFHKATFAFQEIIRKMGTGKLIVFLVSGVVNIILLFLFC
jgi:hypothetical protein